jgi:uncharacterized protein YndB with AHSA1/START domain
MNDRVVRRQHLPALDCIAVALLCGCAVMTGASANAAVMSASASGFAVRETVHIAAPASAVYDLIVHPARWWSPEHTFSHSSSNLTLEPRAGGCFCETLPNGGSVQHLVVIMAAPGKALTLRGALGPFQNQGVDGALSWALTSVGQETDVTLTYVIGGFLTLPGGFEQWAKNADGMLSSQIESLSKAAASGAHGARP